MLYTDTVFKKRGCSSPGRAIRSQRIGSQFESDHLHQQKTALKGGFFAVWGCEETSRRGKASAVRVREDNRRGGRVKITVKKFSVEENHRKAPVKIAVKENRRPFHGRRFWRGQFFLLFGLKMSAKIKANSTAAVTPALAAESAPVSAPNMPRSAPRIAPRASR